MNDGASGPGRPDALVRITAVTKRYQGHGRAALDGISLDVGPGEAVAVIGPSGSGKSTLLNLIAGLDKPSSGTITVAGQRVDALSETKAARYRRTQVGMIFQFFNLLEDLTVADNVLLPAQLAGTPRRKARASCEQLLAKLGIDRYKNSYPGRLSGGERQRVAIARSLINNPAVLLADGRMSRPGRVDTATGEEIGQLLLDRTRHLPGVTQGTGPYPETTITVATGGTAERPAGPAPSSGRAPGHGAAAAPAGGGLPAQQLTVVGRASPSGPLDRIVANPAIMDAITHGHSRWTSRPGEISLAITDDIRLPLGSKITVTSAPGRPTLTVAGYADPGSVSYEDAWVVPSQIPALRAKSAPAQEQTLYAFTSAATTAQINADLAEITRALPAGAVASSQSWLNALQLNSQQNVNTPFVIAFAVIALVLAVLITANVVSAAVIASYRRIGVLKSIGFTPAQVTTAYLAQIGVPALAGAVAGTVLGNWQVLPVIGLFEIQGAHVSVPVWINLTVPLGMLALTGLAAAVPAVRAGRLSAVAAIAAGQAPRAGRGYAPHRLAGRLAVPRPVTIGLAAPFSRPARSAVTFAALTFGLTGVVLAASLNSSIHKINHSAVQGLGQVQAEYRGGHLYTLTPSQNAKILAALRAQPGTLHYVAETDLRPALPIPDAPRLGSSVTVGVAGRPGLPVMVHAYDGDSSWLGWNRISGRWSHGPHEVDASPAFWPPPAGRSATASP